MANPESVDLLVPDEMRLMIPAIDVPETIDDDWLRQNGKCRGSDQSRFYGPEIPGGNVTELAIARSLRIKSAQQVCGQCAIRQLCLEYALLNGQNKYSVGRIGVWGGKTPRQRTIITNQRAAIERSMRTHPSQAFSGDVGEMSFDQKV